MQYARLYVNSFGEIEHIETSSAPLKDAPAIVLHEQEDESADPNDPATLRRVRLFHHVRVDIESGDGRFLRARDLLKQVDVDPVSLAPRMKPGPRPPLAFSNQRIARRPVNAPPNRPLPPVVEPPGRG